jgi:hypothetical protein
MADDFQLSFLTDELEDAGWLGVVAASALLPFLGGPPGAVSSTSSGFVWTKSILSGEEGSRIPVGIGDLVINSGVITVTLGINTYGGKVEIDLLLSLLGDRSITLEMDPNIAVLADRMTRTLPDGSKELIGYDRSNLETLSLPLPSAAIEFSFRVGEDGQITSSAQLYETFDAIGDASSGVRHIPTNPDKVIVFPKLLDIAFAVDGLFIDLSAGGGAADFATRFPEVYSPAWKGVGAKSADILIPLDQNDFAILGAEGFLVGFDGGFSGKVSGTWTNTGTGTFRELRAEVDLRNNHFVKGELSCTLDFEPALKEVAAQGGGADSGDVAGKQGQLIDKVSNKYGQIDTDTMSLDGHVRFSGSLVSTEIDGQAVFGVDVTMASLAESDGSPITALTGLSARLPLWILGLGLGVPTLIEGIRNDNGGKIVGGMGLSYFSLVDMADFLGQADHSMFPQLEQLTFTRLGLRYICLSKENESQKIFELFMDVRLRYKIDSGVLDLINAVGQATVGAASASVNLFGAEMDSIRLRGPLELEFANIYLRIKSAGKDLEFMPALEEKVRRLFEERDLAITVKNLPEVEISQGAGGSSDLPKPIVGVKFVKSSDGEETKYGITLSLKGFGTSSISVNQAAAGIVLYFYPEFDIQLAPQLMQEPRIRFLVPPVCYVEGLIELDKPINAGAGTQNRITVDAGIINDKVEAGKKIGKDKVKDLQVLKNYKYRFGGELAWGESIGPPPDQKPFDFLFAEIHYEGKSPLFTLGPLGVYGLGGLFGRNIAPGAPGGDESAIGLANWIQGSGNNAFNNVKDWPAGGPTSATWHPDRAWAQSPEEEDKDKWAVGLFVKGGSATDNGKTFTIDSLLLVGFPEFWLALAGYAIIKPINANIAVVIVYDHPSRSFLIRAVIEYKVKEDDAKIVKVKTKFEQGATASPARAWFNLGHYSEQAGGPSEATLFSAFNVKFYFVFDTKSLDPFGLIPNEDVKRPTIPGPAIGAGALWQVGPKKYGPSWLHIELFGGLGFNIALSSNPFMVYGDIYAVGYIKVKVLVFKGKLGLAARLYGLATTDAYRFAGQFIVKINMPWPFDDIEESCDFFIESGSPFLPRPALESSAAAFARLESISQELPHDNDVTVPIDGIIALQFNKPIYEINGTAGEATSLVINDYLNGGENAPIPPPAENLKEIIRTEFVGEQYEITYTHVLDQITVRRHLPDDTWEVRQEIAAAWEIPVLGDETGTASGKQEPHHVIYLNTFLAPELQFSADALDDLYEINLESGYIPPCAMPERMCLLSPGGSDDIFVVPEVDQSGSLYDMTFETAQGNVVIGEIAYNEDTYGDLPFNLNRLSWDQGELNLPESTHVALPDADAVDLTLRLGTNTNVDFVKSYAVYVGVELRGLVPIQLKALILPGANTPCRLAVTDDHPPFDPNMLTVNLHTEECLQDGMIIFRFEIVAEEFAHLIGGLTVTGPYIEFDEKVLGSPSDPNTQAGLAEVLPVLQDDLVIRMFQFCFRRTQNERSIWNDNCIAGCNADGSPPGNAEGIDALWNSMLLEPDSEYEISYRIVSTGSSQIQGREEENCPQEEKTFELDSDGSARFRTIRFRTEAEPSQRVRRYVGFTYPTGLVQLDEPIRYPPPYYRDHLTPFLTLKNQGLIRKIYQKHYGSDVLTPRLTDLDDQPIPPTATHNFTIASSPLDEAMEELVEHCLPQAQNFTQLRVTLWETQLELDSAYSLQMHDEGHVPGRNGFSASFLTSRYASFPDHVNHVNGLFADAPELPVLDNASAPTILSGVIGAVINGTAPGYDDAVEAVYQQLLGLRYPRLAYQFDDAPDDVGVYLVGGAGAQKQVWGIVLELAEPLLGKDGVGLDNVLSSVGLPSEGIVVITIGGQNRLILRDRSGSRVLIFNSADGITFAPIQSGTRLDMHFSGQGSVRAAVQDYADLTFLHKTPEERAAEVDSVLDEMQTIPALVRVLESIAATVTIPMI